MIHHEIEAQQLPIKAPGGGDIRRRYIGDNSFDLHAESLLLPIGPAGCRR